jgi:DivIVA domain-containing protein
MIGVLVATGCRAVAHQLRGDRGGEPERGASTPTIPTEIRETAVNTRPTNPEFATAMRGYDKPQVDDYIERLVTVVVEAEERARGLESELEFSRHATVGPRVAQILELAVAEGKELRERVTAETDKIRADAQAAAAEIEANARESADQTRAEAERTRSEILADADARRREALAEVQRLGESKTRLLGDLGRMQRLLSEATGERDAEERAQVPAVHVAGAAAALRA